MVEELNKKNKEQASVCSFSLQNSGIPTPPIINPITNGFIDYYRIVKYRSNFMPQIKVFEVYLGKEGDYKIERNRTETTQ